MKEEIKKQYSDVIMSMSLGYQLGKIDWKHLDNIKLENEVKEIDLITK